MTKLKQNYPHKKESKEARIEIRATPTEKELLQLKAKASGMSLGKYLINAGLKKKQPVTLLPIERALYLELCRQGNNLARLTRLHNIQTASGEVCQLHPDDRAMLEKIYALVHQTLNQLQGRKVN